MRYLDNMVFWHDKMISISQEKGIVQLYKYKQYVKICHSNNYNAPHAPFIPVNQHDTSNHVDMHGFRERESDHNCEQQWNTERQ